MDLSVFKELIKILPKEKAGFYRNCYIEEFINQNSKFYIDNIEQMKQCSDGLCYSGYLWDCLKKYRKVTEHEIKRRLYECNYVMVMWDIHSKDKIFIEDYWKFDKDSVLSVNANDLINGFQYLPEDIYIFDESMKWTMILTHEFDNKRRICFTVGI